MRDSKGRFVAKKRRNPDGAGYLAGGVFHPVRSWAGYDPSKLTNAKERKTEEHEATAKHRYRKPRLKAGSPEQRSERARTLLAERAARRARPARRSKAGTPEERNARAKSLLALRARERRKRELAQPRRVLLSTTTGLFRPGPFERAGRPNWWARVGSGDNAQFLRFEGGPQSARYNLHAYVTVPAGTKRVYVGYGKGNGQYTNREWLEV